MIFLKQTVFLFIFGTLLFSACIPEGINPSSQNQTPTGFPSPNSETATSIPPTETQNPTLQANPNTPIPSPTNTPLACLQESGEVLKLTHNSKQLPSTMNYVVYLPPCYQTSTDTYYPVIYLIHGQSFNQSQWIRLGVNTEADRLIQSETIAPVIIVMPQDKSWMPPSENNFGLVLVEELIPLIDNTYRTLSNRQFRAIGGLSRGGAWAIHIGLNNWDIFSKIGAHSPAVFWSDGTKIGPLMAEIVENYPAQTNPISIYVDVADEDPPEIKHSAQLMVDLLEEADIPYSYQIFLGFHLESYWAKHVEQYLRFYSVVW
jgi:enterochelin esterase-like enzyme